MRANAATGSSTGGPTKGSASVSHFPCRAVWLCFIKGNLSVLGDGVHLCSLLMSSEIKGMFLQYNSKQSNSQGKDFYLKSD